MAVKKYSSEWWRQQPGANGKKIDYSASKGDAKSQYMTPSGKGVVTSWGSAFRPYDAGGKSATPITQKQPGMTQAASRDAYGNQVWSWVPEYGGLGATAKSSGGGGGGGGGGGYGRGGGGGGGGGGPVPNVAGMLALMNRAPQSYNWKDLAFTEYQPTEFRKFDDAKYDLLRSGLTDAITADRTAGNAQYAQLGQEMAAYQNPWSAPNTVQNPAMSAAMQRMMQANNTATDINQADTNMGIQADQAFGNLGSILALANQQDQESRLRSNAGYQRNYNERLDAEQRGGNLAVNMGEAQARELYEQEKWQFGEQIAQLNYNARTQNQQYNNTGQNQTSQQNTQMANEFNKGNIDQLLALLAQGVKVDPNALQNYVAPTGA
jgi:hypothetical protein